MGLIKWKSNFAIGGSVQLGADTNIYRKAANQLATDDGFHAGGTVGVTGAATFSDSATFSGTPFVVPYSTTSPTFATNGDLRIYHKTNTPAIAFRSGGTSYVLQFPTTDHGTATLRVNTVP